MSEYLRSVNQISPLSKDAAEELLQCVRTKTYPKGALIHTEGKVCKHLFFVKSGTVSRNSWYSFSFVQLVCFSMCKDMRHLKLLITKIKQLEGMGR